MRSLIALLAALILANVSIPRLRADDAAAEEEIKLAVPFVTFNLASVDRALTDIGWMFNSIQRSDMNDLLTGLISEHASNLKGYNRTQPAGAILFLDTEALPPRPVFVTYLPVDSVQDALQTMAKPNEQAVRPVVGRADEFELVGSGEGDGVEAVVRVIGSYLFLTDSNSADILDILPNVEPMSQSLAGRYDVALTAQIKAIPQGVRSVFVNFLRTQAEIELQRRDDEEEAAYLVRRANGLSGLEAIEELALEGEEITLGWNAEPEKHSGYLDLIINASPNSAFAEHLRAVASKPSMFSPLRTDDEPLTISVSSVLNKREKTALTGLLQAWKVATSNALPDMAQLGGPIEQLHTAMQATSDAGHFDLFLQMHAVDVGEFVILGGLRVAGAQSFGKGLEQFLQGIILQISQGGTPDRPIGGDAPKIVLNADAHQGVSFHKISPPSADDGAQRLFGGTPEIFLGTSSRALWFSIGAEEAMPALREAMDTLLTAPPAERSSEGNVPVALTVRVAPWMELPLPEAPDALPEPTQGAEPTDEQRQNRRQRRNAQQAQERRELGKQAFGPTDGIRIEGRPLDSGFRTRIVLDEGFVKLLGLIISREYDRSQL
jgi:hypothetical protein